MQNKEEDLRQRLAAAGVERAAWEARLILEEYGDDGAALAAALARRIAGEPLSRIFGHQEFWSLRFDLSPETLDPRADTEILVECALKGFTKNPPQRILDIGTGTGCILISLLHEWTEARGIGTDLAAGAVEMARRNAVRHGVADRATFIHTNFADGIEGVFDLVVSNPPYIRSDEVPNLATNVREYDPILALDGGADGLDAYRSILTEIKKCLAPGGTALFEIGHDQADEITRLVAEYGATHCRLVPDLAGILRVVECRWG